MLSSALVPLPLSLSNLASYLFPETTQAYYDALIEPLVTVAHPKHLKVPDRANMSQLLRMLCMHVRCVSQHATIAQPKASTSRHHWRIMSPLYRVASPLYRISAILLVSQRYP